MAEDRKIETGAKWVRAYLGGAVVADTRQPVLVWEVPYYPAYYVRAGDVRADLEPTGERRPAEDERGEAEVLTVRVDGRVAEGAALRYPDAAEEELRGLVRLNWHAMDAWFEEDEQVFTHPRNPYARIDVLASSRHVVVAVAGEVVADSTHPHVLFETGLPPRWYVPKVDVRMDLLERTDKVTHCPYKGQAEYWSVRAGGRVHENLAWSYPAPFPEAHKVLGMVSFFNEKVDLTIDGERMDRPVTHFS